MKITKLDKPYPAIAIDNFMPPALLRAASNSFPNLDWDGWYTYNGNTSSNTALKRRHAIDSQLLYQLLRH